MKSIEDFLRERHLVWDLDTALRYLAIVNYIKKRVSSDSILLEVGSGSCGVCQFFKKDIFGLDIYFEPPISKYLKPAIGSSINIPFKDSQFDVVICFDMLQYLQSDEQKQAISELIRVGRQTIVIGLPCGLKARRKEKQILEFYKRKYGENYLREDRQAKWLLKSTVNGLPKKDEILKTLGEILNHSSQGYNIRVVNNVNLTVWYVNRWLWVNLDFIPFHKGLIHIWARILLPFLRRANFGKVYRKIFIITKKKNAEAG